MRTNPSRVWSGVLAGGFMFRMDRGALALPCYHRSIRLQCRSVARGAARSLHSANSTGACLLHSYRSWSERTIAICFSQPISSHTDAGDHSLKQPSRGRGFILRSHQNRAGAEIDFDGDMRRNNLCVIPPPKSELVRRTWIPTTSLLKSIFH
jgi:hypothetical protein